MIMEVFDTQLLLIRVFCATLHSTKPVANERLI